MTTNLETVTLPFQVDTKALIGLAGITAGVTAIIGAMAGAVAATFKWADQLDSLQDIMGATNEEAAALNFVLRKSGTATDTLTKAETILAKGLVKVDGSLDTIGKSLKAYGIDAKNTNGTVKTQTQLFKEIGNRYSSFATQTERVNFLTEIFGRSGAELVDVFDTLAQEGGLDKVTEKVKKFGLAIDPNRYEQFNRNLEEMKLIGLGLAVSFTEKVMPVFEKLLGIITDPNLTTPEKISLIVKAADNFVGAWIQGLADSVNNWVNSGGPTQMALKFINWIQGIGQTGAGEPSSATVTAMQNLVTAIGRALQQVNWSVIGQVLENKINEQFGKIHIDNDALAVLGALLTGAVLTGAVKLGMGLMWLSSQITIMNMGIRTLAIPSLAAFAAANAPVLLAIGGVGLAIAGVVVAIGLWAIAIYMLIKNWDDIKALLLYIGSYVGPLIIRVANEAKEAWTNATEAMARGWNDFKTAAIDAINAVIKALNYIPMVNIPLVSGGSNERGGGSDKRRASGGPVIAGQSYTVGEFKSERFTPNQSGRIDKNEPIQAYISDSQMNTLGRVVSSILTVELAKAA
jgi:hypothetical protein